MFICRFRLDARAKHAGPSTQHRNKVFDEFCVYNERHVAVLWMLKSGSCGPHGRMIVINGVVGHRHHGVVGAPRGRMLG